MLTELLQIARGQSRLLARAASGTLPESAVALLAQRVGGQLMRAHTRLVALRDDLQNALLVGVGEPGLSEEERIRLYDRELANVQNGVREAIEATTNAIRSLEGDQGVPQVLIEGISRALGARRV